MKRFAFLFVFFLCALPAVQSCFAYQSAEDSTDRTQEYLQKVVSIQGTNGGILKVQWDGRDGLYLNDRRYNFGLIVYHPLRDLIFQGLKQIHPTYAIQILEAYYLKDLGHEEEDYHTPGDDESDMSYSSGDESD